MLGLTFRIRCTADYALSLSSCERCLENDVFASVMYIVYSVRCQPFIGPPRKSRQKMPPFPKCLIELVLGIGFAIPAHATATMRLDFFHTGGMGQEIFSVDRIVIEPLPWSGNPNQKADSTNRGTYFFEVRDASKRVLYSRGFSSIYGEWITTNEAKTINRTFHESLRFP